MHCALVFRVRSRVYGALCIVCVVSELFTFYIRRMRAGIGACAHAGHRVRVFTQITHAYVRVRRVMAGVRNIWSRAVTLAAPASALFRAASSFGMFAFCWVALV